MESMLGAYHNDAMQCDYGMIYMWSHIYVICSTPKELDPTQYGVSSAAVHSLNGILHVGPDKLQTNDLVSLLEELYCGPIAIEFLHLQVNIVSIAIFLI